MGLPLNYFTTVTSIRDVAGGALYFRPCFTGASCAAAGRQMTGTMQRRRASGDQRVRRNSMKTFYDVFNPSFPPLAVARNAGKGSGGRRAGRLASLSLRFHAGELTRGLVLTIFSNREA